MYKAVDLETWNRNSTFRFFRTYDDPFFNMTVNVDVTEAVAFSKELGTSFSHTALYCSQKAANDVREFRIRLLDGNPVEFESVEATQTILQDDESFSFCYFESKPDLRSFVASAEESVAKYKKLNTYDVENERLDLIYYSVIPWLSFTSFKHASRFDRSQTVPRIVFGKYFPENERIMMPVSVEVNHAIMDGIHLAKYISNFQTELINCRGAA